MFSAVFDLFLFFSVFSGYHIPYPKREFLTDDEQEDKSDTNKVRNVFIKKLKMIENFNVPNKTFI